MKRYTFMSDGCYAISSNKCFEDQNENYWGEAIDRLAEYEDTELTPQEFKESVDFALELNKKTKKIMADLKYYLDTNEENGVVYIPKFVIEKIVYDK